MANSNIIGREKEIKILNSIYKSSKSEFVAIYGRRRVGKSFLVNEVFRGKMSFYTVGTFLKDKDSNTYKGIQLEHFYDSLLDSGMPKADNPKPTNWREAFRLLKLFLMTLKTKRKVIFIDELPWLAGPQSAELIAELGYFWNSWADRQRDVVLVVCGSATSWMVDNVISDYGGLYGRLTKLIQLLPFSLNECEKFYKKAGFKLSRYEQALNYMVMGGIPYYLEKLDREFTLSENIDRIFFQNPAIHQEFREVYTGLYTTSERYIDVVKILSTKLYGLTRNEIISATGIEGGGTLTKIINNLEQSGIVREYPRYGGKRVEIVYQLKDFFTMFYLNFLAKKTSDKGNWKALQRNAVFYTWAGHSFELLAIDHIEKIKNKLRIATIDKNFSYSGVAQNGRGAQIDLVMIWNGERTDYLCEMKFSEQKFVVSADYQQTLLNKIDAFSISGMHKATHSIQLILVTTMGLTKNEHSSTIDQIVTFDDLFK